MSKPKKKDHPDHSQDQKQDQDQKQSELQAQLQGQGQLQGQAQGQLAVQAMYQESENKSDNENKNDNDNKNDNKNSNENKNEVENKVDNKVESKVDNEVDNKVDNKVSNDVENKIENKVETKVDVDVKVDLELGLDSLPTDDDLIDIDGINMNDMDGAFVNIANDVYQDVSGKGNDNAFNLQQVNTLVDNDASHGASVSYSAGDPCCPDGHTGHDGVAGGFQAAYAHGGHSGAADAKATTDEGAIGSNGITSADAIVNQEAFTQNIVMGANIQFNSVDLTVVGNDGTDLL